MLALALIGLCSKAMEFSNGVLMKFVWKLYEVDNFLISMTFSVSPQCPHYSELPHCLTMKHSSTYIGLTSQHPFQSWCGFTQWVWNLKPSLTV